MKKLSKKQKLIGFIAILIMAVVLATVITTNIVNNRTLVNANYSTTTDNANSNMVANYIKKGITLGGVTGTLESLDTSDATATAEDIIWGKTGYVKGEKIIGTKIVTVAHARDAQKIFETNTVLIDDYGNRVKIPTGFKIAEDSATAVTEGVVIEDVSAEGATEYTKGSQFVWVPVGDVITDDDGNITTITLGRYTFENSGNEKLEQSGENYKDETEIKINYGDLGTYYFKELLKTSSAANRKAKDIENFIVKSLNSGGYYIGRYEAGDAYATSSARIGTENISNPNNPITCKSGVYPYTYINQADASNLCQGMYTSSNFESDLVNSYAWDTAIVFIQEFSGDEDYSWHYFSQSAVAKCGEAMDGAKNDMRCNIYDMAGNTEEYSTETSTINPNFPYVGRGGDYVPQQATSIRSTGGMWSSNNLFSARLILYL